MLGLTVTWQWMENHLDSHLDHAAFYVGALHTLHTYVSSSSYIYNAFQHLLPY
jgi:hypothetical protein